MASGQASGFVVFFTYYTSCTVESNKVGKKFKYLTVLEAIKENGTGFGICLCDCGVTVKVRLDVLKRRTSCGSKDCKYRIIKTHPLRLKYPLLYKRYSSMVKRCTTPSNSSYKHYGGRGIKVYEGWIKSNISFMEYCIELCPNIEELLAKGYQIDRIDSNGNYEPGNIRFVTPKQNLSNRRITKMISIPEFGEKVLLPLSTALEKYSDSGYNTVFSRLTTYHKTPLEALYGKKVKDLRFMNLKTMRLHVPALVECFQPNTFFSKEWFEALIYAMLDSIIESGLEYLPVEDNRFDKLFDNIVDLEAFRYEKSAQEHMAREKIKDDDYWS